MPGPVNAVTYARIFEADPMGAAILEELWRVFSRAAVTEGGIDAVLKTYERAGQRNVLEFIARKINQANGVPDDAPE